MIPLVLGLGLALGSTTPPTPQPPQRLRITTRPVQGLGPEAGVARRDPSDPVRVGEHWIVLYTRLEAATPLYPAPYLGEIWYATSTDEGQSWRERGQVLAPGAEGSWDAVGVFEPNLLQQPDGSLWLVHSGVGPTFNLRFENQRRVEPVRLGLARLFVDVATGELRAERAAGKQPILAPSLSAERRFDSLRVGGATPLVRNGIVHLYYRAREFGEDGASSALGLARAPLATGPFERGLEGHAVLPFSGDALLTPWQGGVLALLTSRQRGIFWAEDGEHFARLSLMPSGRLSAPGVARETEGERLWGLHVARSGGDPHLERFELSLPADLAPPLESVRPVPGAHRSQAWTGAAGNWLGQHRQSLDAAAGRPRHLLFLGDGLSEGFGGHERRSEAPGTAVWEAAFADREVENLGIAGDRTEHLLWRVAHGAIEHARCRALVLQIGRNNLERDGAAELVQGIESLLRRVQHELPFTEVVLVSVVPPVDASAETLERCVAANHRLKSLGRWPRVTWLDLNSRLVDPSGRPRPELFEEGGPALSAAGYRLWADALGPILEGLEAPVPEGAARKLGELEEDG